MTEGGKGQLAALKTIVLLSRVGEAAKKGLLKREVVTCLNSTVKAESGEAQVRTHAHTHAHLHAHTRICIYIYMCIHKRIKTFPQTSPPPPPPTQY
jgi:hypothetical protein